MKNNGDVLRLIKSKGLSSAVYFQLKYISYLFYFILLLNLQIVKNILPRMENNTDCETKNNKIARSIDLWVTVYFIIRLTDYYEVITIVYYTQ